MSERQRRRLRTPRPSSSSKICTAVPARVPPHRGPLTLARPSCTAASTRSALGEAARKLKKCIAACAARCRIPRGSPSAGGRVGTLVCSRSQGATAAAGSARFNSSQRLSHSAGRWGLRGCMDADGEGQLDGVNARGWHGALRTGSAMPAEIGRGGHSPPPPGRRPVQAEGPEGASGKAGHRACPRLRSERGQRAVARLFDGTPRSQLWGPGFVADFTTV